MQSPSLSDSGRPESPASSTSNPGSPLNNNNNSNTPNQEMKYPHSPQSMKIARYESNDDSVKEIKPKFSVLSTINKENSSTTLANRNNLDQILYPKPSDRDAVEPSAKFSIERLKQLADQRLSPSNIENSGLTNNKIYSIDHSAKYQNNSSLIATTAITTMSLNAELLQSQINNHHSAFTNHHPHHLNILSHSNHLNNLKYGLMPTVAGNVGLAMQSANNNSSELDIERIKLARTLSNGKELSDFGFRIQLGGLTTSYAHSDTHSDSEELNVDGNEDSSQDGNSVSCVIKLRLIYSSFFPFYRVKPSTHNQFNPKKLYKHDFNC